MNSGKSAIETLLAGLIDYAGLYPPASLDMRSAVHNYLDYRGSAHAAALGRFVVNLDRVGELRKAAGDSISKMRLSVIVPPASALDTLPQMLGDAFAHAALEFKVDQAAEIAPIRAKLPGHSECYFEVPVGAYDEALLEAIAATGSRAKLRMGGVTFEAFPRPKAVALLLHELAERHISFKATAGLHHPVRSRHSFTDQPGAPAGMMHGFFNLAFAAVLLHFGGTAGEALQTLEEEDPGVWRVTPEAIRCRAFDWNGGQILATRKEFLISFGSCSFEEPIRDLEALGWL